MKTITLKLNLLMGTVAPLVLGLLPASEAYAIKAEILCIHNAVFNQQSFPVPGKCGVIVDVKDSQTGSLDERAFACELVPDAASAVGYPNTSACKIIVNIPDKSDWSSNPPQLYMRNMNLERTAVLASLEPNLVCGISGETFTDSDIQVAFVPSDSSTPAPQTILRKEFICAS